MEENEQLNPSSSIEVKDKAAVSDGIDFGSVNALANSDWKPEPWYKRFGISVAEKLVSLGLFILSFIIDIIKALVTVIKGIFFGIYAIGRGIGRFFRNVARICGEGDKYVKLSTVVSGLGNMKGGQVVDGIIFLGAEIIFILYMALFGVNSIVNFVILGEGSIARMHGIPLDDLPPELWLENNSSIRYLIGGVMTVFIIVIYVYVWYSALRSARDNYIIRNNFRFMQAHADQIEVVENEEKYPEFFTVETKVGKDGKTVNNLRFKSRKEIRRIAYETYGFSDLSSRYISYVPLKRTQTRDLPWYKAVPHAIVMWYYRGYKKVTDKIRRSAWSSVFAKYIEWVPAEPENPYGKAVVLNELKASYNQYRHTYDKYNDYLFVTRDMRSLIRVLADADLLEKAVYAEDPVSAKNGLAPIPHGSRVKPKVAASRIIGAFECSFQDAVTAAEYYARAVKDQPKTGRTPIETIRAIHANVTQRYEEFVRVNGEQRINGVHEANRLYDSYDELNDLYASGKEVFRKTLVEDKKMDPFDARDLYRDMAYAKKHYAGDTEGEKAFLAAKAERYADVVDRFETYPFHGQPMHFKRKAKQYLDEKFAVTVLTLPVLGALITSVLPLVISILIAFTNYTNANYATGIFDWDMGAWQSMFGMGGDGLLGKTFLTILGWTLIWAVLSTFTNYILGIVLALLINKKSIKLKSVYRTFFVISIAIPQFVTLLAMSQILGVRGPIHTWFMQNGWWSNPNQFWLNMPTDGPGQIPGIYAKVALVVVNIWIGIPYTMLSTSGILMNIPEDLYESASIDGATPWTQFWKITMPYILFVTGPSLLTTFIGNINNFNVIFFLTGGGPDPSAGGKLATSAGYTDLLITYLFKITVNGAEHQSALGAVIGILVFLICSFFSLIMYSRMGSTKNEEAFQ